MVLKLFNYINELIENEESLIFVLIDEIESLTSARKSSISGNEPSDAIRVVNALLTQIDKLKLHMNVIILSTSNISDSIDDAFVDRIDIKQYIGLPNDESRYEILRSCLIELIIKKIIIIDYDDSNIIFPHYKDIINNCSDNNNIMKLNDEIIKLLLELIENTKGLSGRTLRKLPLQAYSYYIHNNKPVELILFISYLNETSIV